MNTGRRLRRHRPMEELNRFLRPFREGLESGKGLNIGLGGARVQGSSAFDFNNGWKVVTLK